MPDYGKAKREKLDPKKYYPDGRLREKFKMSKADLKKYKEFAIPAADLKRYLSSRDVSAEGKPAKRKAAPAVRGDPIPAIVKGFAKFAKVEGTCAAIRMLAKEYPDVSVFGFLDSLPEVNPSTLRIQYNKGRKEIK